MEDDCCNTDLVLGVGEGKVPFEVPCFGQAPVQYHILFPPHEDVMDKEDQEHGWNAKTADEEDGVDGHVSFNEREVDTCRKKLRLTKEQSSLLEDCFKEHNTLTLAQKQQLAHKLNLRPRQVEVWFQNRRARTKLKQTEVDCESLKKYCENLNEENRRLKKELQELRSMSLGSSLLLQLPKMGPGPTTMNMCPSCKRIVAHDQKAMKLEFIGTTTKDSSKALKKLFQ